jgi:hypothetical protein
MRRGQNGEGLPRRNPLDAFRCIGSALSVAALVVQWLTVVVHLGHLAGIPQPPHSPPHHAEADVASHSPTLPSRNQAPARPICPICLTVQYATAGLVPTAPPMPVPARILHLVHAETETDLLLPQTRRSHAQPRAPPSLT